MPRTRRRRTIAAPPEAVWATVAEPRELQRWWPRVTRVEGVFGDGFTQVLASDKGRLVRADFRVLESRAPLVRRWSQEVAGSPFERLLQSAETEVRLEPDRDGTRVTLTIAQRLRGVGALGGFMVGRATRRLADEALAGLARIHDDEAGAE